jgi:hypothetical protein
MVMENEKIKLLIKSLLEMVKGMSNDWKSKEREEYVYQKLLKLGFVDSMDFLTNETDAKKKKFVIDRIKKVYQSNNPKTFSTLSLKQLYPEDINTEKIYVIREPFGSQASPDFLFVTKMGLFGIEDKQSKSGSIAWNTGTPGGNKFIMYFDSKEKKMHLITADKWGWTPEIEAEYVSWAKDVDNYAKKEFQKRFGDRIGKFSFKARKMLQDKNKVKDIADPESKDVIDFLTRFL